MIEKIIHILSSEIAVGWVVPIVLFILSSDWIIKAYNRRGRIRKYKKKEKINILKDYCENKKVLTSVSYGDSEAILAETLIESGDCILRAFIDVKNKPDSKEKREHVMALLQYIPTIDLSGAYLNDYNIQFEIKSSNNIKGIQLEIKDHNMDHIVDRFIETTQDFKPEILEMNKYPDENSWEKIKEICFTVFVENKYIFETKGNFEIKNFRLTR